MGSLRKAGETGKIGRLLGVVYEARRLKAAD